MYNVDYKLPYVDVCKEFIKFVIDRSLQTDRSRALDVICRPWATEQKNLKSQRKRVTKRRQETTIESRKGQKVEEQKSPQVNQAGKKPERHGAIRCETVKLMD
jgi:hypothetical protein